MSIKLPKFLVKIFRPWVALEQDELRIKLRNEAFETLRNCGFVGNANAALAGKQTFEKACLNALDCHLTTCAERARIRRVLEDCRRYKI